jgi:hypothetical protein
MQQSLQTKHEELLALDEDMHPPYINSNHLKAYKALFKSHGFCCRFKSCPASDTGFPSTKARASHETEHFPTYRCKECDFSVRGFRSKGDLVNHVNKYHANTENIELPAELLPSSPQPGQVPPTPTQSNKAAPKKKGIHETTSDSDERAVGQSVEIGKAGTLTSEENELAAAAGSISRLPVYDQGGSGASSGEESQGAITSMNPLHLQNGAGMGRGMPPNMPQMQQGSQQSNNMQRHIISSLQQQGPFSGWQAMLRRS